MTGDRSFEPAEVDLALEKLAGLWGCPPTEVDEQLRVNLQVIGQVVTPTTIIA
jgi:hypothetical protein